MPLESTFWGVDCYIIHDGMKIPKSTFDSEMVRLTEYQHGYEPQAAKFIFDHYGKTCCLCDGGITLF